MGQQSYEAHASFCGLPSRLHVGGFGGTLRLPCWLRHWGDSTGGGCYEVAVAGQSAVHWGCILCEESSYCLRYLLVYIFSYID